MKNLILITLILFSSCKLKVEKGNGIISDSFTVGGTCHLLRTFQDALCVEYKLGSYSNNQIDTDCDNQNTHYSSINADSHLSSYSPIVDCRSSSKVGSCLLNTKKIYYYNNEFTDVAAQADCTSLSGTYTDL